VKLQNWIDLLGPSVVLVLAMLAAGIVTGAVRLTVDGWLVPIAAFAGPSLFVVWRLDDRGR